MLTIDRIRHAAEVLSSVVRRTDLIRAPRINCESEVYLKTENLQVVSFSRLKLLKQTFSEQKTFLLRLLKRA